MASSALAANVIHWYALSKLGNALAAASMTAAAKANRDTLGKPGNMTGVTMKWQENKEADVDNPVVTVTLSKREIAALYQTAGSADKGLKAASSIWRDIEALASEYGVASHRNYALVLDHFSSNSRLD